MEENNIIICENCYEENEATRTICKNCGAKLLVGSIEVEGQDEAETEPKEEIKKISFQKEPSQKESQPIKYLNRYTNNTMATILMIIGTLEIISTFILGIILGDTFQTGVRYKEFNGVLCVCTIVIGIVFGMFIFGFAEVIQKLQNIEDNTRK